MYWQWWNPWKYIIHKDALKMSCRPKDYNLCCSPLPLSCIFAMAARYSSSEELRTDPNDPATAEYAFRQQAKVPMPLKSEAPTKAIVHEAYILARRIIYGGKDALEGCSWLAK
jgi:hypothetical protein